MIDFPGSPHHGRGTTSGEEPPQLVDLEVVKRRMRDAELAQAPLEGSSAIETGGELTSHPAPPLEIFAASSLAGKPAPARRLHVEGLIPARTVTLLGGDGATGKSLLALQLAAATALRSAWLGMTVAGGASLFLTAEDDKDEVHRRLEAITAHAGVGLEDLHDLHIVSLAGEDALLALPGPRGNALVPTQRFAALDATMADLEPALVVLDTLADLFGGEENSRTHARQFIGLLLGLALRHDTTILLLAHPSLSGMSSGAGTSGSTAWSNSVRSRLYQERVKDDGAAESDPDARVLTTMKANYAPVGGEIRMRWQQGVFVSTSPMGSGTGGLAAYAAKENADRIFLDMLAAYSAEGRDVSPKPSSTYAPTLFAQDTRSQGLKMRPLRDAMNRLIPAKRVKIVEDGPPSKRRMRLVAAEQEHHEE